MGNAINSRSSNDKPIEPQFNFNQTQHTSISLSGKQLFQLFLLAAILLANSKSISDYDQYKVVVINVSHIPRSLLLGDDDGQ